MTRPVDIPEGTVFAGRYRVVRCIAAGGMGAVYEVVHVETQRHRALKLMLPVLVGSSDLRERFQREARVTANINSEFIVDVFDAGIDQESLAPFMVMELLVGEDLGNRVQRLGGLPPADVLTYLRQVSTALDKTHGAGIVHRDLKPENIFLTERDDGSPRVKVLDFGISKVVSQARTASRPARSRSCPSPPKHPPRSSISGLTPARARASPPSPGARKTCPPRSARRSAGGRTAVTPISAASCAASASPARRRRTCPASKPSIPPSRTKTASAATPPAAAPKASAA